MKFKLLSVVMLMAMFLGMAVQGFAQGQTGMTVSSQDRGFMAQAAQSNRAEIMMSQLALQKSTDPQVRALAERLVRDHTNAQQQLGQVAGNLNIVLPIEPSAQQQETYRRLETLSGQAFDMAYLQEMQRALERSVTLYRDEMNQGNEPQVISYASTYLPTLQTHLASVEQQIIAMQQPWQAQPQRQTVRGFW